MDKNVEENLPDDNGSVLVLILQGETRQCDSNITNLKWIFSDPYFIVQVCVVEPPKSVPVTKTLDYYQYTENYSMRKVLLFAQEGPYIKDEKTELLPQYYWKDLPVIIVKDSSISNIIPNSDEVGGMKNRIKTALSSAKTADLFFLCKWNDTCDKYVDVEGINNIDHGSNLKWSKRPTATQAIMYKPSSRDYIHEALVQAIVPLSDILNSNIDKEKLLATAFVPNIIDFDVNLATSNNDYAKLNECAPVTTNEQSNNNTAMIIFFGIITILIVIIAWIVIQTTPSY